ncbi:MAG: heme exporter protein CcmB [Actinomycetota bacterium]
MGFWRQTRIIAGYELTLERRAGDTSSVILPFAMAALVTLPLGLGIDQPAISRVGPAAFWSVSLLYGMQIAWRQSSVDRGPVRDLLMLSGVDPAARFVGRSLANASLLIGFMLIVGVLTIVLFSPAPITGWPWLVAAAVLFAAGLAGLSTIAADLTAGLNSRPGLASLLVAPLAIPLLIAAAQVTAALTRAAGILPWLLLLAAVDLLISIAGVVAARPLEEAG